MNILRDRLGVNTWTGQVLFQRDAEQALANDVSSWVITVDNMVKKPTAPVLMLQQTPLAMHIVGADFKELYAAPHLFDGVFGDPSKSTHNVHQNIDKDVLKGIPAALTNPIAIFEQKNGRRLFLLEIKDTNGVNVVVPVEFTSKKYRMEINLAVSAFSKEHNGVANPQYFFDIIDDLVYVNKKKDREFVKRNGHLLMVSGANSLWDAANVRSVKRNILTDADLVKLKNQYPTKYHGKDTQNARGAYLRDNESGRALIALFKGKANISTVIHEGVGHYFLENLRDAASIDNAPAWVTDMWQKTAYHIGCDADPTQEIPVSAHEKFATMAEKYKSKTHYRVYWFYKRNDLIICTSLDLI